MLLPVPGLLLAAGRRLPTEALGLTGGKHSQRHADGSGNERRALEVEVQLCLLLRRGLRMERNSFTSQGIRRRVAPDVPDRVGIQVVGMRAVRLDP